MYDLFFADNAGWFTVPAIVGTLFFAFRLVLMTIGVGADIADASDLIDAHHGDSGDAFKALSIQGIAAFMMGFGWGGLGGLKGTDWGWTGALVCGIAAGAAMVYLLGLLLKAVYDMQSSGNISIRSTLGHQAAVYTRIPQHGQGQGQIKLVIDNRQRIFNAVSSAGAIETNSLVRVLDVNEDNTVTVGPIE